jgi:hypothetical protein
MNKFASSFIALAAFFGALGIIAPANSAAAPLTTKEEAQMAGNWYVKNPHNERIYQITAGRNLTMSGGGLPEKKEFLSQNADGSYGSKLQRAGTDSYLRFVYVPASDQMTVEWYKSKKDAELGLTPGWRTVAQRR